MRRVLGGIWIDEGDFLFRISRYVPEGESFSNQSGKGILLAKKHAEVIGLDVDDLLIVEMNGGEGDECRRVTATARAKNKFWLGKDTVDPKFYKAITEVL